MSYEDVLIREATGDAAPNPDDACTVCDKIECQCTPEAQACGECGGKMLSAYHKRGSLLPICALCADKYSWPIL